MADLALWINAGTLVAVVSGFAFGVSQILQQNRKRRDAAAIEAVHVFTSPEVRNAFRHVLGIKDGTAAADIYAHPQLREDADAIIYNLEAIGVLVFDRVLPLDTFDHLLGGFTRASFRKLRLYVDAERIQRSPHLGEWYQWLVERLEAHPAPGKAEPAYRSFAAWQP